jgi:hypothetical protein
MRRIGFAIALATCAYAQRGLAQTREGLPVSFSADEVRLDTRRQGLEVSGNVRVDEPPFHLTSDALRLRRVPIGVELEGDGKVAFCPCLGTPLAVRFQGATVAPPHDLIVRQPVLEVFGVPLAWAPLFWLRSPGRLGLLPPEVAWRGQDGLFVGEGIHVPWVEGDVHRGLDLRAGGYLQGGVDVRAALRTTETLTTARWDWLRGSGGVDLVAWGATAVRPLPRDDSVAWDVDALRGARAVQSTTDVDVAAYPFDHGDAQAVWRPGGFVLASGVRSVALRGSDLLNDTSAGPVVTARRGDALGSVGAYDVTIEGGAVASSAVGTTSFIRSEVSSMVAGRLGALVASVSGRGYGDVADDGTRDGLDGAAQLRAALGVPLARAFDSSEANDPWIHRTEPRVEGGAIAVHESGVLVVPAARGMQTPDGAAWVATGTWSNTVGRWGARGAGEVDFSAGGVGDANETVLALRARVAAVSDWVGLRGDVARVIGPASVQGGAALAQARIGPATGLHVTGQMAERDSVDPILARVLVDAPLEPATGFLSATGLTGGVRAALPLGPRITTRGGVDYDLTDNDLVAAVGSLELHDPCNCVTVRATVSHRIGRSGVDAWVTVDLPALR